MVISTPCEERGNKDVGRLGNMSRYTQPQMSSCTATMGLTLRVLRVRSPCVNLHRTACTCSALNLSLIFSALLPGGKHMGKIWVVWGLRSLQAEAGEAKDLSSPASGGSLCWHCVRSGAGPWEPWSLLPGTDILLLLFLASTHS